MCVPCIPRIAGPKPPAYPGSMPDEQKYPKQFRIWTRKAQLFVEFYSLMFLPLDDDGFPFDPTNKNIKILPWEDKTFDSWKNFWKILCSWDVPTGQNPTTKFYKRSMWQIFKNMVGNLRQGNGDRALLRDWRHQCADSRPAVIPSDPNKRSGRNYNNSEENDLLAIEEAFRALNGATAGNGISKRIQDMNKYLNKQINKFKHIEQHAKHITMKKNNYEYFSFKNCKSMEKKIQSDNNDDIMLDDSQMVCSF